MIDEIHTASTILPRQAPSSVFIGGGTPTLLTPPQWESLLEALRAHLLVQSRHTADEAAQEVTVEANPETVTLELAHTLAEGGINRISIGVQSFNPVHLKALERWHEPANVSRAVEHFRTAGIGSINLDLIFGIPGQTLADWIADLEAALALRPTHLSCYGLMYEPNTALTARMQAGRITPIDDELEAAMYEAAIDRLGEAGFEHYEISAWAKSGNGDKRCRHNLTYWENGNWWPLGPGASGHWNGTRWKNVPRISDYLHAADPLGHWPPITDVERVDMESRIGEEFMLGLRLIDGMDRSRVEHLLGQSTQDKRREQVIQRSISSGLLEWKSDRLCFTRRGLLLADEVMAELL